MQMGATPFDPCVQEPIKFSLGSNLLLRYQSLCGHERRGALVLDQEHQEFRRLGAACVPVDDMNIVGAFIEGLSWCQCHLLSTLQLHHDGALQHVNKRMCNRRIALDSPGACSTVIISFPAGSL